MFQYLKMLIILVPVINGDLIQHRSKRYLVFPRGANFKLVIGIAMPIKVAPKRQMAIGWNFQFQYPEPQNASQLHSYPPVISRQSRSKRDRACGDRSAAYAGFEAIMDNEGINGRECLLSAICENALHSALNGANGLYGQLLHIILTPDYGDGEIEPDVDPVYLEAQEAGEFGVDCSSLYKCNVPDGLLNFFTTLH